MPLSRKTARYKQWLPSHVLSDYRYFFCQIPMVFSDYGGFPVKLLRLIWSGRVGPKPDMAQPFLAVWFAIWCLCGGLWVGNTILQTRQATVGTCQYRLCQAPTSEPERARGQKKNMVANWGGAFCNFFYTKCSRGHLPPFSFARLAIWCLRVALCVENTILQTWKSDC
jgi:hypothetical protein